MLPNPWNGIGWGIVAAGLFVGVFLAWTLINDNWICPWRERRRIRRDNVREFYRSAFRHWQPSFHCQPEYPYWRKLGKKLDLDFIKMKRDSDMEFFARPKEKK